MGKLWTVKQVCSRTGLTGKHLHFFHHAGVVRAAGYANYSVEGHDGYKLYDDAGLAKLQQIAMYYELGLKRNEIRDLMKAPDYDMHRALDQLHTLLEEKRLRMERHIAAIEQLRQIGTKNGLLELFQQVPLETLGNNMLVLTRSAIGDMWAASLDERTVEAFVAEFDSGILALSALDATALTGEPGQTILRGLFQNATGHLGFPGFLFVTGLFLSAAGEGSLSGELADQLPAPVTKQQGKAALAWLKQDLDLLLEETARLIACHHHAIGEPFHTEAVRALTDGIRSLLARHWGLVREDEYRVLFDMLQLQPVSREGGYLNYLLNALKYHCIGGTTPEPIPESRTLQGQ